MRVVQRHLSLGLVVLAAACDSHPSSAPPGLGNPEGADSPSPSSGSSGTSGSGAKDRTPSATSANLVSSEPQEGDTTAYPVELYDKGADQGVGERRLLRLTFDAAMDIERRQVALRAKGTSTTHSGTWTSDGKTLDVMLVGTDDASPLEEDTDYELGFEELRSANGAPASKTTLSFHTSARDEVVEHTCLHALFGPFEDVVAAASLHEPSKAPVLTRTHRQYIVQLPMAADTRRGRVQVRMTGSGTRTFTIFTDSASDLSIENADGATVAVQVRAAAPACPAGIVQQVVVELVRGSTYFLDMGASSAVVKAILE